MDERQKNIKEIFMNYVRKKKIYIKILIINGVKLKGIVKYLDNL